MPALASASSPPRRIASARRALLRELLVRETLDGRPMYFADYWTVLAGRQSLESIRGSSSLRWVVASYVLQALIRRLNGERYWFAANQVGTRLDEHTSLIHDVAIYEKAALPPDQINTCYVSVPARVVVEIDVRIDLRDPEDANYVNRKIRKLLDFGTERVIWVFTDSRQVLLAERGADAWLTMDWHRDIELLDGQRFNIGQYLAEQGVLQG